VQVSNHQSLSEDRSFQPIRSNKNKSFVFRTYNLYL